MIRLLQRRLTPSFLIIGTEKGGTTSFFHHLALHPRIRPPRDKEICFFNKDALFDRGTEWYHRQNSGRQLAVKHHDLMLYVPDLMGEVGEPSVIWLVEAVDNSEKRRFHLLVQDQTGEVVRCLLID